MKLTPEEKARLEAISRGYAEAERCGEETLWEHNVGFIASLLLRLVEEAPPQKSTHSHECTYCRGTGLSADDYTGLTYKCGPCNGTGRIAD